MPPPPPPLNETLLYSLANTGKGEGGREGGKSCTQIIIFSRSFNDRFQNRVLNYIAHRDVKRCVHSLCRCDYRVQVSNLLI